MTPHPAVARWICVLISTATLTRGERYAANSTASGRSEMGVALILAGQARSLVDRAVQQNIRQALINPLYADVFAAFSQQCTHPAAEQKAIIDSGVLDSLKPIAWRYVDNRQHREVYKPWVERGCYHDSAQKGHKHDAVDGTIVRIPIKTISFIQQWNTVSIAYKLMLDHEAARGYPYRFVLRTRPDLVFLQAFSSVADLRFLVGQHRVIITDHSFAPAKMLFPIPQTARHVFFLQDQFAILPRNASDAYFNTLDQYDCVKRAEKCKLGKEFDYDCMESSREWCAEAPKHLGVELLRPAKTVVRQSECRLSNQLREHGLCVCSRYIHPQIRLTSKATSICSGGGKVSSADALPAATLRNGDTRRKARRRISELNTQLASWRVFFSYRRKFRGAPAEERMPRCCQLQHG